MTARRALLLGGLALVLILVSLSPLDPGLKLAATLVYAVAIVLGIRSKP